MVKSDGHKGVRALPATGLAALLVVGQLASSMHLLLVPHALCPIHGELIHAEGARRHPAVSPPAGRLPALRFLEIAEAHHGHEHCVLAGSRRAWAVPERSAASAAPPSDSGQRSSVASAQPSPGIALHRLAPKQSPPA